MPTLIFCNVADRDLGHRAGDLGTVETFDRRLDRFPGFGGTMLAIHDRDFVHLGLAKEPASAL